jgi:hypothetical protein
MDEPEQTKNSKQSMKGDWFTRACLLACGCTLFYCSYAAASFFTKKGAPVPQQNSHTVHDDAQRVAEPPRNSYAFPQDALDSLITVYATDLLGHDWKIPIRTSDYLDCKSKNHRFTQITDLTNFVTYNDPTIKGIARDILSYCKNPSEFGQAVLDFTHQQVYEDKIDKGYVRYPLETLVDRAGDCKDASILTAAIMKAGGLDVILLYIPNVNGGPAAHLAVGVSGDYTGSYATINGKNYYYAEAAGTPWLQRGKPVQLGTVGILDAKASTQPTFPGVIITIP